MTRGDLLVERGAEGLEGLARRAAQRSDGIGEFLSEELNDSAVLMRRLKPSLIAARVRGETNGGSAAPAPPASAAEQQPKQRAKKRKRRRAGPPPPLLVVGVAFAAGVLLARLVGLRDDGD